MRVVGASNNDPAQAPTHLNPALGALSTLPVLRHVNMCMDTLPMFTAPIHRMHEVTSQSLWSWYDCHFVGITRYKCVELNGENLLYYSNKIEPVKKMSIWSLTKRIWALLQWQTFLGVITYKMAAKTNWHRYGTKLRHCHPMYSGVLNTHQWHRDHSRLRAVFTDHKTHKTDSVDRVTVKTARVHRCHFGHQWIQPNSLVRTTWTELNWTELQFWAPANQWER